MVKAQQVFVLAALSTISTFLTGCGVVKDKIAEQISPQAIDQFLTIDGEIGDQIDKYCGDNVQMSNIVESVWYPGCEEIHSMADFDKCSEDGCIKKEVMEAMDAFNDENGGKLVTYKSRADDIAEGKGVAVIELTGWWLPAPKANADTPRIVVQHGFKSNSNKVRSMFFAYLLRKLGYSVLVNNLRDHCYSADSEKGVVGWGHAYPLDLLGAWDYAKDHAAEPIDASRVGIIGYSMGGFISSVAFALEGKIPAAWLDGAPFTPKAGFEAEFPKGLGAFVSEAAGSVAGSAAKSVGGSITDNVWEDIEEEAAKLGVDLKSNLPEDVLPKAPDTKRPVFLVSNKKDTTVPFSSTSLYADLFKENQEKYDLAEFWEQDGECVKGEGHCFGHLIWTEEYEAKLCKFWSDVFKSDAACGQSGTSKLYDMGGWILRTAPSGPSSFVIASFLAVITVGLIALVRRMRSPRQLFNEADEEDLIQGEDE